MAEIIIIINSLQRMALWATKNLTHSYNHRMNSALKAEDPKKNINVVSSDIEDTKRRSSSNPLIALWEEKMTILS